MSEPGRPEDAGGEPGAPAVGPRSALGRSAAVMAAGTATSRVLGVVRGAVLVAAIGLTSASANAFAVANWLPNVIYMLIAGGVLNAVLVPQVVRAYRTSRGQDYVDRLLTLAALGLLVVTVVLTFAAPLIIRVAASGEDPRFIALATTFAFWCIPQVFFYGTYTLLGQVLNARGNFGPYMWAPVVNNVVAIAGLGVFVVMFGGYDQGGPAVTGTGGFESWDATRVAVLAGSATFGVVCQALVLLVPLYRSGFRYRPRTGWRGVGLGGAGRVAVWTFAALVVGQLGILVITRITTAAPQVGDYAADVAGNAAYNYAFTIFMLPHSLVTVSLLTALFTRLSAHAVDGNVRAVRADTSYGLRTIGVLTVPATAVLAVLALPVVRVVVPTASPQAAGALAPVVVALVLGLVALGAWALVQRVFYAYEDARKLFWIQLPMTLVVAGGAFLASRVLPIGWWTAGAGAAVSASYLLGAVWGAVATSERLGHRATADPARPDAVTRTGALVHLLGGRVVRVHVQATVAALVAAGVGWPVSRLFGDLSRLGFLAAVAVCLLVGALMLGIYLALLRLMRVRELDELVAPLLVRLRGLTGRTMGGLTSPGGADTRPAGTGADAAEPGGGRTDVVVGRGTLLADRYRLHQPVDSDLPGVDCWEARDQILDRPVRAVVIREGRITQAQDGARRAALVDDARLLRVLDVGEDDGVPYVVTEPVAGRDLALLTAHGPLPADQARSIIGEAAAALEVARRRGLHHLALRPSALHVTEEGSVLVAGLGMDGELFGHGIGDARSTTRADTVGLVSLLYLTLTGRWPAPAGTDPGHTPAAPVVAGRPVPPAEISPAVPNDLDTLCAVTLGPHDDGPHSPAELVRELEPWGPIAAAEMFGAIDAAAAWRAGPRVGADAAGRDGADPDAGGPDGGSGAGGLDRVVQRQSVRSTFAGQPVAPPGTPPPAEPPPVIPPQTRREDPRRSGRVSAAEEGPPRPVALPVDDAATGEAERGAPAGSGLPPSIPPSASGRGGAPGTGDTEPGPRPSTARAAAPPARKPLGTFATIPGAEPAPDHPAPHHPAPADVPRRPEESFDSIVGRSAGVLVKRRFDPTPIVLALVAIAVVVGLVMAWNAFTRPAPPIGGAEGLDGLTETTPPPAGMDDPAGDGEGTDEGTGADDGTGTETTEPPSTAPPVIASAQQIDPPPGGDQNEHPEAVHLAIDGDPSTMWFSRTYVSPTYGMKPGIGYGIALAEPAVVTTVTLHVQGTGGNVEVRATEPDTPTEGEVLASGPLGPNTVLTLDPPTETTSIVLWFTELPQTADGRNRVELTEVEVS